MSITYDVKVTDAQAEYLKRRMGCELKQVTKPYNQIFLI